MIYNDRNIEIITNDAKVNDFLYIFNISERIEEPVKFMLQFQHKSKIITDEQLNKYIKVIEKLTGFIMEIIKNKIGKEQDFDNYNQDLINTKDDLFKLIEYLNFEAPNFKLKDNKGKWMNYIFTNPKSKKQNFPNISKLEILGDFDLKYLNSLKNLKILSLYEYGNELGDSLKDLTNLKELSISNYNHPLGDSLKGLINLEKLSISNYNHLLGDSLKGLINLKELSISGYKHPLGDSLKDLINLEELSISGYKHPLGDSLKDLINLEKLRISNYNHLLGDPGILLGDSLKGLINLKELNLDIVKDDIQNSLLELPKLENLYIRMDRFPYSLKKLHEKVKINMTLGYGKTPDNPECFR